MWPFSKKKVEAPQEEATYVDLRCTNTPVQYWSAKVLYDAWGTPYVDGQSSGTAGRFWRSILLPDGKAACHPYQVDWRHKSGPPVKFETTRSDW